ncbi:MAG: Hsp33 family molecular chaperone HslO [Ectothiorhodospiraceae bacterium]|nr:Hsp33 family molecular chaperone HslO [Chromatiales bacterium]MCP5157570.1 Hsp33 family molecular chaperone HslO [Ectothiorhodospiraceae bacterium]
MAVHPDTLQRFLLEASGVRGELVHLDQTWQTLLERQDYPAPVRRVLGEAAAAVALLASTIKFDGSLILQASGGGPLTLLVVEASGSRTLRGLARWRGTVPEDGDLTTLFGRSRLAITVDPGEGRERYQGLVELEGAGIADALQTYFDRSEQLPTRLWLAADGRQAAGMMLQRVPGRAGREGLEHHDPDAWDRHVTLADTVTSAELLGLGHNDLLRRLYHQEAVRVFEPERWGFGCRCSRERVKRMLLGLGQPEVEDILAEQGHVQVDCEFCAARYRFDQVDVAELFCATDSVSAGDTRH